MPCAGSRAAALTRAFAAHYGGVPRLFQAPGRVNLIGEHTDYNQGWVMPAAIRLRAWVGMDLRSDAWLHLRSAQFSEAVAVDLRQPPPASSHWSASLLGLAWLLAQEAARQGKPWRGANLLLDSEVPMGSGLSSSAAAEVAVGLALAESNQLELDRTSLARLCQAASHQFAGTRCGLMDPYIACHGRAGAICELDTRDLHARWRPWPDGVAFLVCDTGVRHSNASSGYNDRRRECEQAAALLGVAALREVTRTPAGLPAPLDRRCRHVMTENARVGAAASALEAHDFSALGTLLNLAHASLRDDFEVSCPELDTMAELCQKAEGVYGARMMGGGFGGCVLALVRPEAAPALPGSLGAAYGKATRRSPAFWLCHPAAGAAEV